MNEIFKNFPSEEVLEKYLREYAEQEELSFSELAAKNVLLHALLHLKVLKIKDFLED